MNGPEHRWRKRLDARAERRRKRREKTPQQRAFDLLRQHALQQQNAYFGGAQQQARHAELMAANLHSGGLARSFPNLFRRWI